jgi:DNA-directed RNA polymerase subunit RPC12/RpoP
VAIPCRQCGREYDVTLFEFGRTIWCTCGSRVGLEPRVRELPPTAEKRFVADVMLGRLARWLRLLGLDCAYDPEIADEDLARLGVSEGRIVLTRDRRFPEEWWIRDVHLVREEEVRSQLVEVIRRFDLGPSLRVLTRCAECNRPGRMWRGVCRSESSRLTATSGSARTAAACIGRGRTPCGFASSPRVSSLAQTREQNDSGNDEVARERVHHPSRLRGP